MNDIAEDTADHAAILYVDDAEVARRYFERTFGEDYAILPAADAHAAIALLRGMSNRIGIVIADEDMPGRSGVDLLRQVAEEFPHVVRILATERADSESMRDAANSGGGFCILEKPLDSATAANALRTATGQLQLRNARQQRLQAIDEAIAFLTHELNTPLAAILNFARGMQRRLTDVSVSPQQQAEIWKASVAVDDNARYCLALVSSFAEAVKAVRTPPDQRTENTAHQVVVSMLDTYPLTHAQRCMIRVELEEDFPVTALPNCVSLALSALLGYALCALKDSPTPSICFTVAAGDHPHICIADNGPGIPPDVLDRLMIDPVATRADDGKANQALFFCKRIMEVFGGEMTICSAQGIGTTITLYFPPAKASRATPP